MKKKIIVSAINFRSGGPLSILNDCLEYLDANLSENFDVIALIHKKSVLVETNNIGDKSISAGEQSNLYIEASKLRNTAIGITSKDGSQVTVRESSIEDYNLFGVMSYVKKDFYPQKPSIELLNCIVDDGVPYLRQTGSSMIVNGKSIVESEFNVDLLYAQPDNNSLPTIQ